MVLGRCWVALKRTSAAKGRVFGSVSVLYAEGQRGSNGRRIRARVEDGVEVGVVVHFHLAIEAEAAFSGEDFGPEEIETGSEIGALVLNDMKSVAIAGVVLFGGRRAVDLLRGVEEFERKDGEAVDDEAGGFGVERSGFVLRCGFKEECGVDLLDEVVAALVDGVDGVLDGGDGGVGGGGGAGVVFLMPEVEVGAVLGEDEVLEFAGDGREGLAEVPARVGLVLHCEDGLRLEHTGSGTARDTVSNDRGNGACRLAPWRARSSGC